MIRKFILGAAILGIVAGFAKADAAADKKQLSDAAAELDQHYGKLAQALKEADRSRFEPQAIIETVGREAPALTDWVAKEIDLLPYRGCLRGAGGTLMDRGGNTLDRSLLLAELLSSAGYEVRLANATLSPEQATAAAAHLSTTRLHGSRKTSDKGIAYQQRVSKHAAALLAALGDSSAAANPNAAASLSDYWWVQYSEDGKWIDADPSGTPPAAPAKTVAYTAGGAALKLDDALYHTVTVRVVIEAFNGSNLASTPVLTQTIRSAEAYDKPLVLTHHTGNATITDLGQLTGVKEADGPFRKAVLEQAVFVPVMRVSSDLVKQGSFDTAGHVEAKAQFSKEGKLAGSIGSAAGGAFGFGGGDAPSASADALAAEWVEYEIKSPGCDTAVVRRMVFDLIGPAARSAGVSKAPAFTDAQRLQRGLALAGSTKIAIQSGDMPSDFVVAQMAQAQVNERAKWKELGGAKLNTPRAITGRINRLNTEIDFSRLVAMVRRPVSPQGEKTFIDRPNVIQDRTWGEEIDGRIRTLEGIDLAYTSTAALGNGKDGFNSRVVQGVADTMAEALGLEHDEKTVANTIRLFEAAGDKLKPTVLHKPAELDALNLPSDVKARTAADLAAGNTLVLARLDSGRCGWWRVGADGQTVGVMDNGYNAAMTEEVVDQEELGLAALKAEMGAEAFNGMTAAEYMQITGQSTLYEAEWNAVLQAQGKLMTIAQQIARGMFSHIGV